MRKPRRLIESFLCTDYGVHDGTAWRIAHIGERNPAVEALAGTHGIFITAWNPFARQVSSTANAAANRSLARILAARGFAVLPHKGVAARGDWVEEGFFVPGLRPRAARHLARAFGQRAIVAIARGRKAELIWVL